MSSRHRPGRHQPSRHEHEKHTIEDTLRRFVNSSQNLPYPLDNVPVQFDEGSLFSEVYTSAPFDPFK